MKVEIEVVKSKKQATLRAVSILLYKLATADSENVVAISEELRRWHERMPNQEFRPRR